MSVTKLDFVPLDKLVLSPDNVRTAPVAKEDEVALIASIESLGLLQPLVVRAAKKPGRFEVLGGGRRLDALKALAKRGVHKSNYPTQCVIGDWKSAKEASLAENIVRCAMDPVDQFRAYVGIQEEGKTAAQIAKAFGQTERHVQQRLQLGRVAPEILSAYQSDRLNLETLEAFCLTTDHQRQLDVWRHVQELPNYDRPSTVRRMLTKDATRSSSPIARFVGAAAFEKAGGVIAHDLFSRQDTGADSYFENADLLHRLATEKLVRKAKALSRQTVAAPKAATGKSTRKGKPRCKKYAWCDHRLEVDPAVLSRFRRVFPQPIGLPKSVETELEQNRARVAELKDTDPDAWTTELETEADRLENRYGQLQDIVQAHMDLTSDDRKIAGCIVTFDKEGRFNIHDGLVRPEDSPERSEVDEPTSRPQSQTAIAPKKEPTADETFSRETGIRVTMSADLRARRIQIAQAHLASNYQVAFDATLYSLCIDAFSVEGQPDPLNIHASTVRLSSSVSDLKENPATERLEAIGEGLNMTWLQRPEADRFEALSALPDADKQALFSWCVSRCLLGDLSFQSNANLATESIINRLGIDFAKFIRPTAENFWGRVLKGYSLSIAAEVLGQDWANAHARDKKIVLAGALERAFSGDEDKTKSLDTAAREQAANWVPPGFEPLPAVIDAPSNDDAQAPVAAEQPALPTPGLVQDAPAGDAEASGTGAVERGGDNNAAAVAAE